MSGLAVYGAVSVLASLAVILAVLPRLRRLARYAATVRGNLGTESDRAYDESVVVDMYNLRVRPQDAAATLIARRSRAV